MFGNLELVPPGVVPLDHWRPGQPAPAGDGGLPCYGGLGRKS
jgi:hypothetical protein